MNKRPDYLGEKPTKSPSSTHLQSTGPSHPSLEVFEQPLPGRANKNIYEDSSRDTQHIATKPAAKRNPQPLANYTNNSHSSPPVQQQAGRHRQQQQPYEDNDNYGNGGGNSRAPQQQKDDHGDYGGSEARRARQQPQGGGGGGGRRQAAGRYRDEDDGYGNESSYGDGPTTAHPGPADVFEQPLPGKGNKNIYEDTSRDNQHIGGSSTGNNRGGGREDQRRNNENHSNYGGGQRGGGRGDEYEQYDDQLPSSSTYKSQFTQEQARGQGQRQGGRRPAREQEWNTDTGYEYEDEGGGGGRGGGRHGENVGSVQDDRDRRGYEQQQQQAKPARRRPPVEKPGWNDDFVEANAGGFGEPSGGRQAQQGVQLSNRPPFQNNVERDDFLDNMDKNYDQRQKSNPNKAGVGRGSRRAAANANNDGGGGWNSNTDVNYDEPPAGGHGKPAPRVSPRLPAQSHGQGQGVPQGHAGDGYGNQTRMRSESQPSAPPMSVSASADVNKARSGLSQLKARIRTSRGASTDSQASRTMDFSGSLGVGSETHSHRTNSAPNEYAQHQHQQGYGQQQPQQQQQRNDYRNSGTAPKHVTPRRDLYQQGEDHAYVPTGEDAQARRRGVGSQRPQQKPVADPYDDMDTPPKPSRQGHGGQGQGHGRHHDDGGGREHGERQRREEAALRADDAMPDEYGDPNVPQVECPDCGRKFNESAFARHAKICKKVFVEKRKTFDMAKKRVEGDPELAKALKKAKEEERRKARQDAIKKGKTGAGNDNERVAGEKVPKWKADREQFRAALKAGKEYSQAAAEGKPLPPVMASAPDPTLIPCPHCGRRFNDKAAERHIPKCQDIKSQPKSLKRGSGIGIGTATNKGAAPAAKPKRR